MQRFFGEEMNLPQVWHARIPASEIAVLDGGTCMRVALDTKTFEKIYLRLPVFAKMVVQISGDGDHGA